MANGTNPNPHGVIGMAPLAKKAQNKKCCWCEKAIHGKALRRWEFGENKSIYIHVECVVGIYLQAASAMRAEFTPVVVECEASGVDWREGEE